MSSLREFFSNFLNICTKSWSSSSKAFISLLLHFSDSLLFFLRFFSFSARDVFSLSNLRWTYHILASSRSHIVLVEWRNFVSAMNSDRTIHMHLVYSQVEVTLYRKQIKGIIWDCWNHLQRFSTLLSFQLCLLQCS